MPSLGTLTLDLIAKVGGFTAGMTEAERASKKSADAINKNIQSIGVAGYAVGNALGQYLKQGIDLAISAFPDLIDQAAQFQDIADKTGGSAQGFANFAVSAKVAGVEVATLADASVKLAKGLVDVDSKSSPAAAGLKALGINVKEFTALKPDEQIEKIADSFSKFADGGEKAAVAQQLFGRSGADLLKFFKDYTDSGGAVTILTADMIKQADDFADANARAKAELGLYASALATQALPAVTALTGVITDLIKEMLGFDKQAGSLAANTGFRDFAYNAGEFLAELLDRMATTKKEFAVFADFFVSSADAANKALHFDFSGAAQVGADFRKKYNLDEYGRVIGGSAGKEAGRTFVQQFKDTYAANARSSFAASDPRRTDAGKTSDGRPKLTPISTAAGASGNTAAQEAKARLASDLDAIKNAQKEATDSYANSQKVLEAMHSAGLTEDSDYYRQKKQFLDLNTQAEVTAQEQTIARLQQEKLTGKDAIDNAKKIADAQYQLNKARADSATQSQILAIQEQANYRKIRGALLSAQQAAQDYFDTVNQGYAAQLAGVGQGSKNRDFQSALTQITEKYQQQRQTLANQRAQAELQGTFGPDAQKQYDAQLSIINDFQAKAIASYKTYYGQLDAAQNDWKNGATEALKNYADEASNTAKLTEDAFSRAFGGLEDVLTTFVTTGKLNFKELANSIIADFARIAIKQSITGPLASALSGAIGGGGSSAGGFLSSLFSSGATTGGSFSGLSANTLALGGYASGGYTGPGGINQPAGIIHKGEIAWSQADIARAGGVGAVENMRAGNGSGFSQQNTFVVAGNIDRSTQTQLAAKILRETNTAARRFA